MTKPVTKKQQVGRIAFRVEGEFWIAFFADNDTMEGATTLGMISMALVRDNPPVKQAFMDLMKQAMQRVFKETIGQHATYKAQPPSEN